MAESFSVKKLGSIRVIRDKNIATTPPMHKTNFGYWSMSILENAGNPVDASIQAIDINGKAYAVHLLMCSGTSG